MSFVVAAVAVVAVGTAVYSSDQQRKALHQQQDALKASQQKDAEDAAAASVDAQKSANEQLAATKSRRRANALALGDPNGTGDTLGSTSSVLGSGSTAQAGARPASTVLGSAAK